MSHDTWAHRMVRPLMRPLAQSAIAPDHVTWGRISSGIMAAAAFATGDADWRLFGAALFTASFFLDRADGELARLSGKTSPFGHKLDLGGDALCNALAFVGLGIGLAAGTFGVWAIVMGVIAGLAVASVLVMVWRLEAAEGARSGELETVVGFDADDGMLAVPILIWFGLEEVLLGLAAVGAPLFCLGLIFVLARRSKGSVIAKPARGRGSRRSGNSA